MKIDKYDKDNLEKSFNMAKDNYKLTVERCNLIDQKLNMVMVLSASLLIAIVTVFFNGSQIGGIKNIFRFCLIGCCACTIILILLGFFPKRHGTLGKDTFKEGAILSQEPDQFIFKYLEWFDDITDLTEKTRRNNLRFLIAAIILLVITFILFFIALLV